jgi:hypothetical protein
MWSKNASRPNDAAPINLRLKERFMSSPVARVFSSWSGGRWALNLRKLPISSRLTKHWLRSVQTRSLA